MKRVFKPFFVLSVVLTCVTSLAFAQSGAEPNPDRLPDPMEDMELQQPPMPALSSKEAKALERKQQAALEDHMKMQKEISQIMGDYSAEKISKEEARRKLFPLLKQRMPGQTVADIDAQINALKEQLSFFEKLKKNPDYMIDETISQMLDINGPKADKAR